MAAVAEKQAKRWTYEEYYKLDDDQRYEVIDGDLISMSPAPGKWHQDWVTQIFGRLYVFNTKHKRGWLCVAPVDVVLSEENCVQPDIVFVTNENIRIAQQRAVFGAPDLAIELLSPSSGRRDRIQKKRLYQQFSVKEYWIGDPSDRTLEVLTLREGRYETHCSARGKGLITSLVLPGFTFDLAEIE